MHVGVLCKICHFIIVDSLASIKNVDSRQYVPLWNFFFDLSLAKTSHSNFPQKVLTLELFVEVYWRCLCAKGIVHFIQLLFYTLHGIDWYPMLYLSHWLQILVELCQHPRTVHTYFFHWKTWMWEHYWSDTSLQHLDCRQCRFFRRRHPQTYRTISHRPV